MNEYAFYAHGNNLIAKPAEEIKPIPIDGLEEYYISKNGTVYHKYNDNGYHIVKSYIMSTNGYLTSNLICNGKHKSFRNHRLVAITWIPNPNNLPVVGHKDNNKTNNTIDNLYWTTYSANTQKAVDDELLVNDKGYDDSQSLHYACFDLNKNFIKFFGSAGEIHRELGVSKSTVARQANHEIKSEPRCGYYFRYQEEYEKEGFVL